MRYTVSISGVLYFLLRAVCGSPQKERGYSLGSVAGFVYPQAVMSIQAQRSSSMLIARWSVSLSSEARTTDQTTTATYTQLSGTSLLCTETG